MTTLETALSYLASGWSLVPVLADGSKKPSCAWKKYQETPPSEAQVRAWYKGSNLGIALIQGAVSGRTEVLDFDSYEAWESFTGLVREHGGGELLDRFPRVVTPSGGRHVYWRIALGEPFDTPLDGNLKLASATDKKTLIETRGEGGYTIAPGSPSACHPIQKSYKVQEPGDLCKVPTVSTSERTFLLGLARSLNRFVEPERMARPAPTLRPVSSSQSDLRPGEDYNNRNTTGSMLELLTRHGWTCGIARDGGYELLRPGKSGRGSSATLGIVAEGVLYVFSSNAAPFEPEHGYDPFGIYALLEAGGDYALAARQLAEGGFGTPPSEKVELDVSDLEEIDCSEADMDELNLTDAGNAERLIALFGKDLRHVPGLGWRIWDGRRWSGDETHLTRLAREMTRSLHAQGVSMQTRAVKCRDKAMKNKLTDRGIELVKWALKSENTSKLAAMIEQASSFTEIKGQLDDFSPKPWVVPFQNGVWDRGEWREHRREDYIEVLLPISYFPKSDRSEWDRLLGRMTGGDMALAKTCQDVAGYSLSGASSLRILPWLYGPRGSGKSTYAELLLTVMGGAGKMLDWSLVSGQREAERLGAAVRGLRAIVLPEAGKKRLSAEILKSLSGSDRIPCRHLYKDVTYSISPTWVLMAVSNDPPSTNAHDDALKDRVMALPFIHSLDDGDELVFTGGTRIEEVRRDPNSLLARGFLAWAMEGLERVYKTQEIFRAPVVWEHTRRFWADTDPLTPFWEGLEEGILEEGMSCAALHSSYVAWCETQGIRKPLQGRSWAAACRAQGLEEYRSRTERGWKRFPEQGLFKKSGDTVTQKQAFSESPLRVQENRKDPEKDDYCVTVSQTNNFLRKR